MFSNLEKTARSKLLCRPRGGGDPVTFAAKPLDSRWSPPPSARVGSANDTERLRFIASRDGLSARPAAPKRIPKREARRLAR